MAVQNDPEAQEECIPAKHKGSSSIGNVRGSHKDTNKTIDLRDLVRSPSSAPKGSSSSNVPVAELSDSLPRKPVYAISGQMFARALGMALSPPR